MIVMKRNGKVAYSSGLRCAIVIALALVLLLLIAQPVQSAPPPKKVYIPLTLVTAAPASMLDGVNAYRASNGKPKLAGDPRLAAAAQAHADDMARNNFFSHTGSDGSRPSERVTRAGYAWSAVAENLALNSTDCAAAVTQWVNSPPHKTNMLGSYSQAGIGMAKSGSTIYHVLVLANPQ